MNFKEVPIFIALVIFVAGVFLFGIFGVGGFFSEDGTHQPWNQPSINIEEIRKNADKMDVDEIEKTILEIEKEIERLESQING